MKIKYLAIILLISFPIILFFLGVDSRQTIDLQSVKIKSTPASSCGPCPKYSPPSSDFCKNGTVIPGKKDICGCQLPPTCQP